MNLFLAVVSTSALAASPTVDLEQITVNAEGIGGPRTAWVHVPDGPGPWPVVLAYHGGRNHDGTHMAPRFARVSDENILFVFPDGSNAPPHGKSWVGPGFERFGVDPGQDVRFARALVDQLATRWTIDRDQVYAAGFSAGGYMTQQLWCSAPDLIQGAFVVGQVFLDAVVAQCRPPRARPIAFVVGTEDHHAAKSRRLSLDASVAFARDQLGCTGGPRSEILPDRQDLTVVTHRTWDTCRDDSVVESYEIEGGGHFWPGAGLQDPQKSRDVDATHEALRFFRQHAGLAPPAPTP